ncbi:hypothetical protein VPH35_072970 [Triticum aestivum]
MDLRHGTPKRLVCPAASPDGCLPAPCRRHPVLGTPRYHALTSLLPLPCVRPIVRPRGTLPDRPQSVLFSVAGSAQCVPGIFSVCLCGWADGEGAQGFSNLTVRSGDLTARSAMRNRQVSAAHDEYGCRREATPHLTAVPKLHSLHKKMSDALDWRQSSMVTKVKRTRAAALSAHSGRYTRTTGSGCCGWASSAWGSSTPTSGHRCSTSSPTPSSTTSGTRTTCRVSSSSSSTASCSSPWSISSSSRSYI